MKKMLILLVSMSLLISLCACSKSREPYTVKEGWRTFEIDPEAGTISHKTDTYQYDISGDGSEYTITITYPDGSAYFESHKESFPDNCRIKGRSSDYGDTFYVSGDILCKVLENELPVPSFWKDTGSSNIVSIQQEGKSVLCAIEPFYEDEYAIYYFPYYGDSQFITVTYLDGKTENIIPALEAGRVTIVDLKRFGIDYGIDLKMDYWPMPDNE